MSKQFGIDGVGSNVELGKGGSRVKQVSGVVQARTNDDSAYARVQGADGTTDDDLVTKRQLDASGGGGGWSTAYAVDFTALATLDIKAGGDGTYDIGDGKGTVWIAQNTASSTVFGITNGVGLDFQSSTVANIYFRVNLQDLATTLAAYGVWRLIVKYTNYGPDQQFENVVFMIENSQGAPTATLRGYGASRGFTNGPGDRYNLGRGTNEIQNVETPTSPVDHTLDNVFALQHINGYLQWFAGNKAGSAVPANLVGLTAIEQSEVEAGGWDTSPFQDILGSSGTFLRLGINNSVSANRLTVQGLRIDHLA